MPHTRSNSVAIMFLGAIIALGTLTPPIEAEPLPPDFKSLKNIVEQYFYHARSRNKPILLTQSKVHDLLEELRGMHIYIPGRTQIVRSFPHDKEFFTRFALSQLQQEPSQRYPDDPTFLFQRIDAMCTSHETIRYLNRVAGRGRTFSECWTSEAELLPPPEELALEEMLEKLGVASQAEASPRRRNYTIKHLLEVLEQAYNPERVGSVTSASSFNALGR